jgi:hypothetical protein
VSECRGKNRLSGYIQSVPGGNASILEVHSIGHSKEENIYIHVAYCERFPRYCYSTVQCTLHCTDKQHTMSSHQLQIALRLMVEFSKL